MSSPTVPKVHAPNMVIPGLYRLLSLLLLVVLEHVNDSSDPLFRYFRDYLLEGPLLDLFEVAALCYLAHVVLVQEGLSEAFEALGGGF